MSDNNITVMLNAVDFVDNLLSTFSRSAYLHHSEEKESVILTVI